MGVDGSKAPLSCLFGGLQLFSIIRQKMLLPINVSIFFFNSILNAIVIKKKSAGFLIYDDTFLKSKSIIKKMYVPHISISIFYVYSSTRSNVV